VTRSSVPASSPSANRARQSRMSATAHRRRRPWPRARTTKPRSPAGLPRYRYGDSKSAPRRGVEPTLALPGGSQPLGNRSRPLGFGPRLSRDCRAKPVRGREPRCAIKVGIELRSRLLLPARHRLRVDIQRRADVGVTHHLLRLLREKPTADAQEDACILRKQKRAKRQRRRLAFVQLGSEQRSAAGGADCSFRQRAAVSSWAPAVRGMKVTDGELLSGPDRTVG